MHLQRNRELSTLHKTTKNTWRAMKRLAQAVRASSKMLRMEHVFDDSRPARVALFDFRVAATVDAFRVLTDQDMGGA